MKHWVLLTALAAGMGLTATCAHGSDDKVLDQKSIDDLEARAKQAQPREQCFLYAELVHEMAEYSARQYAAGDVEKAMVLLKQIEDSAQHIHLSISDDNKRLKNAEIQLRHAAFRLTEMLHDSSVEDRANVQQALAQVTQAETDALLKVFRK